MDIYPWQFRSKRKDTMEDEAKDNKVTSGDIEFALFLADSEDHKEASGNHNFVIPPSIYKVYIETSTRDDGFDPADEVNEVAYNVYVSVDGMYFMIGQFGTRKQAVRLAEVTSLQLEKDLKQKLIYSLNATTFRGDEDE
jgi:hypothetical protein